MNTLAHLYWRNVRNFPRMPSVLVFGIVVPVIQLTLFGSIFSATTNIPGNPYADVSYILYIAPAIIMLTTFLGMANVSAALIVDLRTGYFDKLRTTPARPWEILVARLLADMTRVTFQGFLVLVLAIAVGGMVATGVLGAIAIVLIAAFFSAVTIGPLVMALSMATKSDEATQSAFPLFFVLVFLSTAYMPKPLMPDWLQTVVTYNPVNYLIQALRDLTLEGWPTTDLLVVFGALAVAAPLVAWLNVRVYRRITG